MMTPPEAIKLWWRIAVKDKALRLTAAGTIALLNSLPAVAAPPDFCRDYATAAINQVRAAQANPGCVAGAKGPRWVPNESIHLRWCLTQSIPMVESERGARTAYLRACRG
jgi:hypothetical protein